VTLDGKPLASGSITFQPTAGTSGPSAGGAITNGQFELPAASGVMPGKYNVVVQVMLETGKMLTEKNKEGKVVTQPEIMPVTLKEARGIPATVTDSGSNKFKFEVNSIK